MGETIYSGLEITKMLQESGYNYKPRVYDGKPVTVKPDKKDAEKAVEDNNKNVKPNIGGDIKPVKFNTQETGLNNNKDNLDLEYDSEPSDSFKDRVKKQVVGTPGAGADVSGNEKYLKAKTQKSKEITDKEHITKTTGLVSQHIDIPKPKTVFENIDRKTTKILNFKNTKFNGKSHVFSLIPESYQKDGSVFIMKDKCDNEYLIEWRQGLLKSEPVVIGFIENKKFESDMSKIKKMYEYKSSEATSGLSNKAKQSQDSAMVNLINKVRGMQDTD
jgi:hypothetical protein